MHPGLSEDLQPYEPRLHRIAREADESVCQASESQEKGLETIKGFEDRQNRERTVQIDTVKAILESRLSEPEFTEDGITVSRRGNSCKITIDGNLSLAVRTVPKDKDLYSLMNHGKARVESLDKVLADVLFGEAIQEYALCMELYSSRDQRGVKAVGVAPLEDGNPRWEDIVLIDHQAPQRVVKDEDDFVEFVNKMKISEPEIVKEGDAEENGGESTSHTA